MREKTSSFSYPSSYAIALSLLSQILFYSMAMGEDLSIFVKSRTFDLQMLLIEDGQNEDHLFEAESLLSLKEYNDVVIERTNSKICGYPVCRNALPSQMGCTFYYSIHQENLMLYCSGSCKFNSITFALRLGYNKSCSVLSPDKKLAKEVEYVEDPEAKRKTTEKEAEKSKKGRERRQRKRLINYGFVKKRNNGFNNGTAPRRIETGFFSKLPPELIHHILKFMSFEDLMSCSLVCSLLNYAASDESLWHRLYHMRWGSRSPAQKLMVCPWKVLYIQHDAVDLATIVKSRHNKDRKFCIRMLINKRREAPHLSLVNDDRILLDKSLADEVTSWKSSRGLSDIVVTDHGCSAKTCSYYRIGDAFICEKTGQVHVCDDTCKQEVLLDVTNEDLCCTISLINHGPAASDVTDEAETFKMQCLQFFVARTYLMGGDNCADERSLTLLCGFADPHINMLWSG
ncbi:hypothetical protein RIF29_37028 [Crotalaria pallida]|uniref:F-box domain-containing protein n=1 Tax=Crotalaria pallida TaxID=3830 RepID=A0AAN9ECU9_CROPI